MVFLGCKKDCVPTNDPTFDPSNKPSNTPTGYPTWNKPTKTPSNLPSIHPTLIPTMATYNCNIIDTSSLISNKNTNSIADNRQPSIGLRTMIAIDGANPFTMDSSHPQTPFIGQITYTLTDSSMTLINQGKYVFFLLLFCCFVVLLFCCFFYFW